MGRTGHGSWQVIRFIAPKEPDDFDEQTRKPGNAWLAAHPIIRHKDRPKDFWTNFKTNLADGFRNLCAYTAMHVPEGTGTVDHYLSCKTHRHLLMNGATIDMLSVG
jgi:hypothetical protein